LFFSEKLSAETLSRQDERAHTVSSLRERLDTASVVATTCIGTKHMLFQKRRLDVCIVDEASQISQTMCIGPLSHADRFVLVGDHYQLPPLVRTDAALAKGMAVSLFKRLAEAQPHAVRHLCSQYRMNSQIMALSNALTYSGRLRCGTTAVAEATLDLPTLSSTWPAQDWRARALAPSQPVVFLDTDGLDGAAESKVGDALQNPAEAAVVGALVAGLATLGVADHTVGVIAPYRSQLRAIDAELLRRFPPGAGGADGGSGGPQFQAERVEVLTVDRYQGRDKDTIIFSLVRSNANCNVGSLLLDWRRVNVAITRAKKKLIFVGSRRTLQGSATLSLLLTRLSAQGQVQALRGAITDSHS
jgi:DNA replication ATP-dependent helicase Dna2